MPAVGDKCSYGCADLRTVLRTGIEQKDLAAAAKITPAMLNHLLYGRKRPSNKTAFSLEHASNGQVRAEAWAREADDMRPVVDGIPYKRTDDEQVQADLWYKADAKEAAKAKKEGRPHKALTEAEVRRRLLQNRLYGVGYTSFVSLSAAAPDVLAEEIDVELNHARTMIAHAKKLSKS